MADSFVEGVERKAGWVGWKRPKLPYQGLAEVEEQVAVVGLQMDLHRASFAVEEGRRMDWAMQVACRTRRMDHWREEQLVEQQLERRQVLLQRED